MEFNVEKAANLIGTVGSLAGAINPVVGTGIIMAGKALEKLNQMNDDTLEDEFVGLEQLSKELHALSVALSKFSKMIG
jgi:hypothetical protein